MKPRLLKIQYQLSRMEGSWCLPSPSAVRARTLHGVGEMVDYYLSDERVLVHDGALDLDAQRSRKGVYVAFSEPRIRVPGGTVTPLGYILHCHINLYGLIRLLL
jgi:hypothetical protein